MLSDPGCVRSRNEDSIRFFRPSTQEQAGKGSLAIVADGMGGHQAGDRASQLAADTIAKAYYAGSARSARENLKQAFLEANKAIFREASMTPGLAGMGTTATVLALFEDSVCFAHVGDSRLYLLRDERLEQLSEDHTLVMAMLRDGLITPEQARNHPDRHVITRAIGSHSSVEVMVSDREMPLRENDTFILCSDGLHDLVPPPDIRQALEGRTLDEACRRLVDLAKRRGGHDNISVLVVRCLTGEENHYASRSPVTRSDEVSANV